MVVAMRCGWKAENIPTNPGCGCSPLGKYKIGNLYYGRFGLAYKLYGLDKTNNNAFRRFVVLHSHECVPETEEQNEICQSDGCPTVTTIFAAIKTIDRTIFKADTALGYLNKKNHP